MKKTAVIFLILILITAAAVKAYSLIQPVNKINPEKFMVEIEPGMSGMAIGEKLEDEGIIKSSLAFYILLRLQQEDQNLKAGYYSFSTADTPQEILTKIITGSEERFKVTIPEGLTAVEIIDRISSASDGLYEYGKFVSVVINLDLSDRIEYLDDSDAVINPLEGLIIPETYYFPKSYSEKQIIDELLTIFFRDRLPKLKKHAADSQFNYYELLTIASLIEEEAKLDQEKPVIASVIYNRLNRDMLLQIDASVQYAFTERKERVLYSDLEIESPYNTYKYSGLPPGPISSPGEEAVKAAADPAESDFLFYFAREDGSHVFTKTYEEHLQKQKE
ncbi:MAG: endolytic transglycosylase MltG [Bacillota bacterium]